MSGSFPHLATDLPAGHTRRAPSPGFGTPHRLVIGGTPEQVSVARAFVGGCSAAVIPARRGPRC